jgi:Mor family transcriptional regulator
MKRQYINPVCKVMTLNLKRNVMNELFGNTSYIPVGDAGTQTEYDNPPVNNMYSNKSVWDD